MVDKERQLQQVYSRYSTLANLTTIVVKLIDSTRRPLKMKYRDSQNDLL
jgi:hypothetical protein